MSDLIDRQKAIRNICNEDCHQPTPCKWKCIAIEELEALPSVQPTHPTPSNTLGALDCVSREDLTKEIEAYFGDLPITVHYDMLALAQKLPSVQPELSNNSKELENKNGELISRQDAIDIERNATVDTNPSHFEAHQKFTQFMDDAEISSFGRWQWSNGFNTALTAVGIDLKKLPSAQPRKGKWLKAGTRMGIPLFECSLCECAEEVPTVMGKPSYNFCPNCGCRMEEGESDEVN